MAVGDNYKEGLDSYVSIAKETTFGTYVTGTAAYEALSSSINMSRNSQKIEGMFKNRGSLKRVLLDKNTAGTIEGELYPDEGTLLIINAMGGGITTASLSASSFTHSVAAGAMDITSGAMSLSVTERKGDSHMFAYVGGRVNSLKISGSVGETIKMSADLIFKDGTTSANDVATSLSVSAQLPYTFVDGSYRYGGAEDSLTVAAVEKIQSFELTINNNLKPEDGRALGSAVPSVIPVASRSVELSITQRFDTTTAIDRHLSATVGSVQIRFDGSTIGADAAVYSMVFTMPKVYQNSGGDPEIGGRDETLKVESSYDVIVDDPNTTTGKDIALTIIDASSSH